VAENDDDSQEKSEEPSQRRLDKALEDGQILTSKEVMVFASTFSGMMIVAASALLVPQVLEGWRGWFQLNPAEALLDQIDARVAEATTVFIVASLIFGVPLLIVTLVAQGFVGGLNFAAKAMAFKGSRINPIAGLGRIFSVRSLVELIKAIGKFVFVGGIGCIVVWSQSEALMGLARQPIEVAILEAIKITAYASLLMAASLGLIAIIDAPFQLWRFGEDMKMSRDDVRQEMKESDGSPENKSRIRSVQSALSRGRMMQDVPKANVVITNPTHYAVALRYDEKKNGAPVVIAKGADEVAAKIRELAAAHGVPLVSAPPLARALFRYVDLGREIPAALYVAVAQILTYVWQLRQATRYGTTVPTLPVIDPAVENIGRRAGVH